MRFLVLTMAMLFYSGLSHAYSISCQGQVNEYQFQLQSQGGSAVDLFDFEVNGTGFDPLHDSGSLQTQTKMMQGNILVLSGLGQLQVDQFEFEIQLNPLRPQNSVMVIHFEDGESMQFPLQCRSQQLNIREPKLASTARRAFPISLPVEREATPRY